MSPWEPPEFDDVAQLNAEHADKMAQTFGQPSAKPKRTRARNSAETPAEPAWRESMREWVDGLEPETEPADGAQLLDELRDALNAYVVFPDIHASAALALWITTTHALPAFEFAPRLVITSPQKRCAKSRLLDIIAGTCHQPLATVNATVAAVFRSIGDGHPPTLLIDEADTLWGSKKTAEHNEDLRALLNSGHQRGRTALRCVGPLQVPTEFPTFAMAALAGIGALPDTITDRAVNITMRRRAPGETVSQFRSRRDGPRLEKLRERLAEWASASVERLQDAMPEMPVEDRAADTWEPLVAIADAMGGHWPDTARAACTMLVNAAESADEERSLGTRLLSDVRDIFAAKYVSFLPSAELATELRRIEDAPWGDFELSVSKLAYRLKDFGIKTRHNPAGTARGYRLEDFSDAFARYTRQSLSEPSEPQAGDSFASDGSSASDGQPVRTQTTRQNENVALPGSLTDLTPPDGYRDGEEP
jgi:hypothetical protein